MAIKPLEVKVGVASELDPDKNVTFSFDTPLAKADTAGMHLYAKHDTLWYRAPFEFDSIGNREYVLRGEWRPDIEYSLEVDSAAFEGYLRSGIQAYQAGIQGQLARYIRHSPGEYHR